MCVIGQLNFRLIVANLTSVTRVSYAIKYQFRLEVQLPDYRSTPG